MARRMIQRGHDPYRGSHLPMLMKILSMTVGPVAELGCGNYSTPFLHWLCHPTRRKLVTYEASPDYYPYAQKFATYWHEIVCVSGWDTVDLTRPWTVAFVDCDPGPRAEIVKRVQHADYIVCHDTEPGQAQKHHFDILFPQFKYRWDYTDTLPHTSILSNLHDLSGFTIP